MIIRNILSAHRRQSKGISLTFSAVLEGLFLIGAVALLFWLFLSKILDIRVAIDEATTERHAINLANVLISSEKLAYKDEKILRGVLDSSKLDNLFIKKNSFILNPLSYMTKVADIGIGYPNTLNQVVIIDLEKCGNDNCDGWIGLLSGPISIEGLSIVKFTECMGQNIKIDVGSIFRGIVGGIIGGPVGAFVGTLWQPWDLDKCIKNTIPPSIKGIFTGSPISSKGLPILIRYQDGTMHIGRIIVGVAEWV